MYCTSIPVRCTILPSHRGYRAQVHPAGTKGEHHAYAEREMLEAKSVRCAINPETGQELIYPRKPASKTKNVWVVGAGPAGLTAAFEADRLGHQVMLFEKEKAVIQ